MTLNGVIALISLYVTEFNSFAGLLRHSGWRQTYTVCRISSSTFGPNWLTLQRGLSATAELLVSFTFHNQMSKISVLYMKQVNQNMLHSVSTWAVISWSLLPSCSSNSQTHRN